MRTTLKIYIILTINNIKNKQNAIKADVCEQGVRIASRQQQAEKKRVIVQKNKKLQNDNRNNEKKFY